MTHEHQGQLTIPFHIYEFYFVGCIDVSVSDSVESMLECLGYKEVVRVSKVRRKCKSKGYEICIDNVDGLGEFVEVEKMSDEDADKVQEELFEFLMSFGVKREDRVEKGYDTLVWELRKTFK